jgi:type VI protein secretion system component VasK
MLFAEFAVGQVFWSLIWFFLFFIWIMLLFSVFGDIFRSSDLSGLAKAAWIIFVIFLPFLGVFVYLIARGRQMNENAISEQEAQKAYMDNYIRSVANTPPDAS